MSVAEMKDAIRRLRKMERHDPDAPSLPSETLIALDRYVRERIIEESHGLFNTAERVILQDFYIDTLEVKT